MLTIGLVSAGVIAALLGFSLTGMPALVIRSWYTPTSTATITFTGDVMLDRRIRRLHHPDGYQALAPSFTPHLYDADIAVANLEGPITHHRSISVRSKIGSPANTRFTFAPKSTAFLLHHGIDLVSLGNNHATDFGMAGVRTTEQILRQKNIGIIGSPRTPLQTYSRHVRGIDLGFIAYNQFGGTTLSSVASRIEQLDNTHDWVIVYAHWGSEYTQDPTPAQRRAARRLANAGADIIVGSHPHVIQHSKTVNGARVYYSLGNFIFDQYWNKRVRCGAVVTLTFSQNEVRNTRIRTSYLSTDGTTNTRECSDVL